ncbi:MAG: hypothetical protein HRU46_04045 [Verrucomicrobiales bacterium]|nr:hypothetical protein [Verrucomicrobiales bacterium]
MIFGLASVTSVEAAEYFVRAGAAGTGLSPTSPAPGFATFQASYNDGEDNTIYVSEGTYTITAADQILFSGDSNAKSFTIKGGYLASNDEWLEAERVLGSTTFSGNNYEERTSPVFAPSAGWGQSKSFVEGVTFEKFQRTGGDLFIAKQRAGFRLVDCTVRDCVAGSLFDFTYGGAQASGFSRCRFYDCSVSQDGGVIYTSRGRIFVENTVFANISGSSGKKGTILYAKEDFKLWFFNNTFYNTTGHDGVISMKPRSNAGSKRDLEVHLINNLFHNTASASAAQIAVDESVSDPEGKVWALYFKNNLFDIDSNPAWTDTATLMTLGYTLGDTLEPLANLTDNLQSPGDATDPDFTSTDTSSAGAFAIGDLSDAIDGALVSYLGPDGAGIPTIDITSRPRDGAPDIGADEGGVFVTAYDPGPAAEGEGVDPGSLVLSWAAGETASSHHVYFGLSSPPAYVGEQSLTYYEIPSQLLSNTTYFWRIDEEAADGTIHPGEVWSFRTQGGGSMSERTMMTPKLENGFAKYQPLSQESTVNLPGGGTMDISQPASAGDLAAWKSGMMAGDKQYLNYFHVPNSTSPWVDRHQNGPGITGEEFRTMGADGNLPPDDNIGHVVWLYGVHERNVYRYYVAYRLSDDPYYIDQLLKWAEGFDWVLQNKPYLMKPIGEKRDEAIANGLTVDDLPNEPAGGSNFGAHAFSAVLALEYIQANPGDPNAVAWQAAAKANLETVETYLASLIGYGPNLPQYGLPEKMTDILNNNPWNQCIKTFAVLNAARVGFTILQELEGSSDYQNTIDLYFRVVDQGMKKFTSHSDFFMMDGTTPFVGHAHGPSNNSTKHYDDHFLNGTEDLGHAGSQYLHMLTLYDIRGDEIGVSEGFMAGFSNCLTFLFDHPFDVGGEPQVGNRTYSPWEHDKESIEGNPGGLNKTANAFDPYAAFNPDYPVKLHGVGHSYDQMYLEFARHLYSVRLARSQKAPSSNEAPVIEPDYFIDRYVADVRRPYVGPVPKILSYGWPRASWSIVSAPAGTTIDATTGIVTWPQPVVAGNPHTFTIRFTNSEGHEDLSWEVDVETVSHSMGLETLDWNELSKWDGTESSVDPGNTYVYRNVGDIGPALLPSVDDYQFDGGTLWLNAGVLQLPSENDNTVLVHDLIFNGGDFSFPTNRRWTVKGHWTLKKDIVLHNRNNGGCYLDLVGISGDKRISILGGHGTQNKQLTFNNSTSTGSYLFDGQTIPNGSAIEGFTGTIQLGSRTDSNVDAGIKLAFDADITTPQFTLEMYQATTLHEPQLKLDRTITVRNLVIFIYDINAADWVRHDIPADSYSWSELDTLGFGEYFTDEGGTLVVDDYIDTGAPSPDPAGFTSAPVALSDTEITMTATAGWDSSGPVEYYFAETSGHPGGADSGWQLSPDYTDIGLASSTPYVYTVTMRDALGNTGLPSAIATATTLVDATPPTPGEVTWSVAPTALDPSSMTMTATPGVDAAGPVEYYFAETSGNPGGTDSGWQTSATYIDTGLSAGTLYTYTVTMRDALGNTGTASEATGGSTLPLTGDYYIRAGASGTGLSKADPAGSFAAIQGTYSDSIDVTVHLAVGTYTIGASEQILISGDSNARSFTIQGGYDPANDNWLEEERILGSTILNGDSQTERSSPVFATTAGWSKSKATVEGVIFEQFQRTGGDLFIATQRAGFRLVDCTVRDCVAGSLFDFPFDNIGGAQPSGFTRCRILDCTVTNDGGVVYASRGKVLIDNCIFANLTGSAGKEGGVIYSKEDMNLWLINNTFHNITGHEGLVMIRPRSNVGSKRDLTVHVVNNLISNPSAASVAQIAVDETVSDPEGKVWALNLKNNLFNIGATNAAWTSDTTLATLGYTLDQSSNLVSPGDDTAPDFTSTDTSVATAFSTGSATDAVNAGLDSYSGPDGSEGVPTSDIFGVARDGATDIGAAEHPVDVTPPAAPSGLLLTAGDASVSLDWDDSGEGDFDSYRVYRSVTPGVYGAALVEGLTDSSYIDFTALNGITYYYTVTAVDSSGNESGSPAEVSATPVSPNPGIRITEYYLTTGDFTGTTTTLTLDQDLAADYFILVRGSRTGDGHSVPDNDYARVVSVPSGRGDLVASAANNQIGLQRASAAFEWEGVVTVVESQNSSSPGGFKLIDAVVTSMTTASGTDTSAAWTDVGQVVLFGGYRGGGVELLGGPTNRKEGTGCYTRLHPSGTDTLNWSRDAGGETLFDATMTTFVVEWGSEWTVQHANVSGNNGGNGADATGEYSTAAINPVNRDETWLWATGTRLDSGIGDCAEACLVTLGDGVNQNAVESLVAVGSEYTDAYDFDVYTLSHPDMKVDHRFKVDGDSAVLDLPVVVDTALTGVRFGWVYNGINGTGNYHPRSRFWARYTDDSTVTISRGSDGNPYPAWVQGIDFSGLNN